MPEEKEEVAETEPVYLADIKGRTIKVNAPTETQAILMGRSAQRAQVAAKKQQYEAALMSMVEALDILDYLVVEDDDRAYITDLMRQGKLEAHEVLDAIAEGAPKKAPTTGPVRRVTRGKSRS